MKYRHPITDRELRQKPLIIRRCAAAFDLLSVHIHITDEQGVILYANPAATVATGFDNEEIIGHNAGDLWGGHETREYYSRMWHRIKYHKIPFSGIVHNRRKDGSPLVQHVSITPILDAMGDATVFITAQLEVPGTA